MVGYTRRVLEKGIDTVSGLCWLLASLTVWRTKSQSCSLCSSVGDSARLRHVGDEKQAMATTAKPMNPREEGQRQSGDVLGNAVRLITGEEHFYKSWKEGERRVLSISLPGGAKDGHKDQKIMIQHSTCKLLECTYNSTCKFQCLEKWYLIVHLSLLTI